MMLKKLQRKFIFLTTLISVIVLILLAVTINLLNYSSIISYSDDVLNILLENNLKMQNEFNLTVPPHPNFPKEFSFTTRFFVLKADENNEINYIDTKNIGSITPEEAIEYFNEVNEIPNAKGTINDYRYIKAENDIGYTYIFLDMEEDIINFENFLIYSILIVFLAIILIFVLACLLSKRAVSPIINSYEKQKRFITDVSHEFKTPLTIIKADCDVIELDNGEGEWTTSIKSQVSSLNKLVEDLVSLTKLEEEQLKLTKSLFSLSEMSENIISDFNSTILNANLKLTSNIEKNINYNGDEIMIKKLITILVENAIKYSDEIILINLSKKANKIILTVENSCKGIKVKKYNDWFDRFYRADESRNSSIKGFGIGLSIAKNICEKHSIKILAESKIENSIIITVHF